MRSCIEYEYTKTHSLEERREEAERIRSRYPKRIPVVCEVHPRSTIGPLDKNKYLVPEDLTIGQFSYVIRRRLKLKPETAVFILINNTFPSTSTEMFYLYDEFKDESGFLFCQVSGENTFGS